MTRIAPGGFRELGPLNWVIAKAGARVIRAPRFSLVDVLGQHPLLFLAWGPQAFMLRAFGKLSRQDAEDLYRVMMAVRAQHRLLHDVPRLTAASVHVSPAGELGAAHHAELAHHRG